MNKLFPFLLCLLALMSATAGALEIPRRNQQYFHNTATSLKLPDTQARALESKLGEIAIDYPGVQMAVLVVESLENESLDGYSMKVAEQWKLGQKRRKGQEGDKGLLLTVALAEKKYRFEVGYGLEDILPDSAVGTLGREVLAPAFRAGRYVDGIHGAIDAVRKILNKTCSSSARPLAVPPRRSGRFLNYSTHLHLNDRDRERLEIHLESLASSDDSVEMAVLVIDSLSGVPIDNFAGRVAGDWRIGRNVDGDGGVLLVIAMNEKKYRFEVGRQLQAVLPARLADAIGREILITDFLAGEYADGIDRAIDAVEGVMRGSYPQVVALSEGNDERGLWERLSDILVYHTFSRPTHFDYVYGDRKMADPGWEQNHMRQKKVNHWAVIMMVVIAGVFGIYHFLLGGAIGLLEGVLFSWLYIGHAWPHLLLAAAIGLIIGMASKYLAAFAVVIGISGGSEGGGFGGGGASGSW